MSDPSALERAEVDPADWVATITAARDLAQVGVRVNTIAPGTINTPMLDGITPEFKKTLEAGIPFPQRLGEPADYAKLAAFLADGDPQGPALDRRAREAAHVVACLPLFQMA